MVKYGLNLDKYAEIIIRYGLNVQRGQEVVISSPVNAYEFVRVITKKAYELCSGKVTVFYDDDEILRSNFLFDSEDEIKQVPEYVKAQKKYIVDSKACYLGIISDDPCVFEGVDAKRIAERQKAIVKACPEYRKALDNNETRWCLVAYPEKHWAETAFKGEKDPMTLLGSKISQAMWLDCEDVEQKWKNHVENLKRRSKILNEAEIVKFHYKNSLGTDFEISMPDKYIFSGASDAGSLDGVDFIANMPTQEVFSSPDKNTAQGKLVASLPLVRNGVIIDKFYFVFDKGKVVEFGAEKGEDTLREILNADEGMKRLGEIALVGYNSPIRQTGTLFYETLFDENASCHFALGKSFSSAYQGGTKMSKEELKKVGLNDSVNHVDFMVGTSDLEIIATKKDGSKMVIFKDGDWAF